jgi:hypothetical protein
MSLLSSCLSARHPGGQHVGTTFLWRGRLPAWKVPVLILEEGPGKPELTFSFSGLQFSVSLVIGGEARVPLALEAMDGFS